MQDDKKKFENIKKKQERNCI